MNDRKKKFFLRLGLIQVLLVLVVSLSMNGIIPLVAAQTTESSASYAGFLALGAALAVGLGAIGSGIAIRTVGTAAISALTERDSSFGRILVLVVFAETLAVYGFIIGILLFSRLP